MWPISAFLCEWPVAVFVVWEGVVYVVILERSCIKCCGWCFPPAGILLAVGCTCVACCKGT